MNKQNKKTKSKIGDGYYLAANEDDQTKLRVVHNWPGRKLPVLCNNDYKILARFLNEESAIEFTEVIKTILGDLLQDRRK